MKTYVSLCLTGTTQDSELAIAAKVAQIRANPITESEDFVGQIEDEIENLIESAITSFGTLETFSVSHSIFQAQDS